MTKDQTKTTITDKPLVAISDCITGSQVRYDGGHKRSRFCTDQLGQYMNFKPFCPEVAIGLPVPRPPIHIEQSAPDSGAGLIVTTGKDSKNYAPDLEAYADSLKDTLNDCCGYIFMQKSPSCGVFRSKIYAPGGKQVAESGPGLFAARVMENHPLLPVEESGRLNDAHLRENFVTRVYCYHRWQQLAARPVSLGELQEFYARHKYLLMAHSVSAYQRIGKLLANHEKRSVEDIAELFFPEFIQALENIATRGHHTNVLQHLQGYLKDFLDSEDKQELAQCILKYREGLTPLVAPITLLKHHARKLGNDYLNKQYYLDPYPEALGLRNAI